MTELLVCFSDNCKLTANLWNSLCWLFFNVSVACWTHSHFCRVVFLFQTYITFNP